MGAGFPPLVNGGWVLKFFVCRSFPIISERCHQRGGGQAVRRRPGMGAAETRPYITGTRFGSWRTRGRIIVFAVITGHIRTPGRLLSEDRRPVPSAIGWAMARKRLFGYILWRIRRRERRRQGFAVVFVSVRGVAVLPHPVGRRNSLTCSRCPFCGLEPSLQAPTSGANLVCLPQSLVWLP